jgi:hypothetical protein
MLGIVHITPAIWVRDGDRSPLCLGDADDLADWLGRKCASLMRGAAAGDARVLELEALLARVEAAIDADDPHLPPDLRRDVVAAVARLDGISVTAAVPDGDAPASWDASPGPDAARRRPPMRRHPAIIAERRGS